MSLPRVDASGGDSSYGGSPAVATYCKQARVHGLIALCQHAHTLAGGVSARQSYSSSRASFEEKIQEQYEQLGVSSLASLAAFTLQHSCS